MTRIALPEHPLPAHPRWAPDPALLDALAAGYLRDHPESEPSVTRFLFGFAPTSLFGAWLDPRAEDPPSPGALWLLSLAGWFGGRWLRARILAAQPRSPLAATGAMAAPATPEACLGALEAALPLLDAAEADASAARACSEALPGWVSAFGYNLGYLEQILEVPPEGSSPPPNFVRPDGPLWCEYRSHPLPALNPLWAVARRVAEPDDDAWRSLVADVPALQAAGVAAGRAVWSTGLSVAGLAPDTYRRLLELSAAFLAVVQATALTAASGLADDRPERARTACRAGAGLAVWQASYALGLRDARDDDAAPELPRFV